MGSPNHLRLLYWNPGGVRDKVSPLRLLAQTQNAHIVLLGETKLQPNFELRVPNYFCYRRDEVSPQGTAYRGTAVLVRRDLVHEELEDPPFAALRSKGVLVNADGRELRVFAAYRPPGPHYVRRDTAAIFCSSTPTILAGDLNAKHRSWGSRTITPAGRLLYDDAEANGFEVLGTDAPTHIPTCPRHAADVIDIVLHKNLRCPIHTEVLYDMDTQHLPLLITMALAADFTPQRSLTERIDWREYAIQLEDISIGRLTTPEEVETAASYLAQRMTEAKDNATKPTASKPTRRDELPHRIQTQLRKKRETFRLWTRTRCPRIKSELNKLTSEVAQAVEAWRGLVWETRIDEAAERETNLHNLNRQLTNLPTPIYPLVDDQGQRRFAPADRAEILAAHLEVQFSPHPVQADAPVEITNHHLLVEATVADFLACPVPHLRGEDYISPAEVRRTVLRLPRKKAPGCDGLPNLALRQLPRRGVAALTMLFNGILRTGHFPNSWKVGKVIMLPKSGKDRRQPSSYRPITLLPTTAKLFERLLLRRLAPHIEPRPEQFGFRTQHSTTLQLTRVLHYLAHEQNSNNSTISVFLDIEKAFDRVWHAGLILKLASSTTPPAIIQIIASFLRDRSFYVAVENTASQHRPITAGVPQGSCLSPALYALYTDDIPTLSGQLQPGERDVTLALFADDSAFFSSSISPYTALRSMQRLLDILPAWLDKWRIAVNVGKTAALLVTRRRITLPPLKLRGQDIEWKPCVRYLGVDIDRSLRMKFQVERALQQTRAARAMLRPVLTSKLPLKTKIKVYKSYIRSRLTYAAPAWYALCSTSNKKRIQAQQNIALRICTGAGRYVRNDVISRDAQMSSVEDFVVLMARRMYDHADNCHHSHLNAIAPLHARPPDCRTQWRPLPRELLASPVRRRSEEPQLIPP